MGIVFDAWEESMGGMGMWIGPVNSGYHRGYDLGEVSRVSFWARGNVDRADIEVYSPLGGNVTLTTIVPSAQWQHYEISIPLFMASWPADKLARWEAGKRSMTLFQFTVWRGMTMSSVGELSIDHVRFDR